MLISQAWVLSPFFEETEKFQVTGVKSGRAQKWKLHLDAVTRKRENSGEWAKIIAQGSKHCPWSNNGGCPGPVWGGREDRRI